jgi:hypothetical protein
MSDVDSPLLRILEATSLIEYRFGLRLRLVGVEEPEFSVSDSEVMSVLANRNDGSFHLSSFGVDDAARNMRTVEDHSVNGSIRECRRVRGIRVEASEIPQSRFRGFARSFSRPAGRDYHGDIRLCVHSKPSFRGFDEEGFE